MAPKRLSETEKQEIAERYRQPKESTATLSRTFGVSTSTIGRLLKSSFTAEEYDELVQQKRLIGRGGAARSNTIELSVLEISDLGTDGRIESEESGELAVEESVSTESIRAVIPGETARHRDSQTREIPTKRRSRTRSRTRSQVSRNPTNSPDLTHSAVISTQRDTQLGLSLDDSAPSPPPILRMDSEAFGDTSETHSESSSRRRRRRSSVHFMNPEADEVTRETTDSVDRVDVTQPTAEPLGDDVRESAREFARGSICESSELSPAAWESEEVLPRTQQRRTRRIAFASPVQELTSDVTPQHEASDVSSEVLLPNPIDLLDAVTSPVGAWTELMTPQALSTSILSSPPLSEAILPKTCYLVVDRLSELISRPLQDFEELGEIPPGETQEQTLPIFDNHRVARRFANRSQRVMKIPDSGVLQKTGAHLQAKGITRLLIDGKVYSLS